ncbi:hypothetical protein [Flocculibacter collagenilyticus]|uniref:hypothetical protein n=1 Tax=Flocculibacter collagenilyticus TaxID=2744479 RepID=UPI0018F6563E|nr:hypothetical protein [Flocculibacter collagenilyticus]
MNKWLLVGIITLALAVFLVQYTVVSEPKVNFDESVTDEVNTTKKNQRTSTTNINDHRYPSYSAPVVVKKTKMVAKVSPKKRKLSKAELKKKIDQYNVIDKVELVGWQTNSGVSQALLLADRRKYTDEYASISLEEGVSMPLVGETLSLPLPEGESLLAKVEKTSLNESGESSWTGYNMQNGQRYPVVFTQAENNSYATISSPRGSYILSASNNSGVIYKVPTEEVLNTFYENDQLVPEPQLLEKVNVISAAAKTNVTAIE